MFMLSVAGLLTKLSSGGEERPGRPTSQAAGSIFLSKKATENTPLTSTLIHWGKSWTLCSYLLPLHTVLTWTFFYFYIPSLAPNDVVRCETDPNPDSATDLNIAVLRPISLNSGYFRPAAAA